MAIVVGKTQARLFSQALIEAGVLPPKTISYSIACDGRQGKLTIQATYYAEDGAIEEFSKILPMRLNEDSAE